MADELNLNDGTEIVVPTISPLDKLLDNIPKTGNVTLPTDVDDNQETAEEKVQRETEEAAEADRLKKEEDEKTNQETNKTNEVGDEDSIISEFKTEFGEVEGEFEESTDGLKEYFKKVTPLLKAEGEKEGIQKLFQELPVVQELVTHLAAGYGIESFQKKFEAFDYTKLEVKEDDKELQEKLYRAALKAKGNTDDDIEDLVETAKDGGKLFDKAKTSITVLDGIEKAQIENIKKAEKVQSDAIAKEETETLQQIDTILKSGNLAGVKLSAEEIKELRAFGTVADEKGLTERDKKWNALSLEQMLLLDKIVMSDFKGLGVSITPSNAKVKSLKDLKDKGAANKKIDLNTSSSGNTPASFKQDTRKLFQ